MPRSWFPRFSRPLDVPVEPPPSAGTTLVGWLGHIEAARADGPEETPADVTPAAPQWNAVTPASGYRLAPPAADGTKRR